MTPSAYPTYACYVPYYPYYRVMTTQKQNLTRRIYVLTFLQVFVPGTVFSVVGLVISLFRSGTFAEYTRLVSVGIFLVGLAGAFLRVLVVFVLMRLREKGGIKRY
jgi:hypothetical protein